MDIDFKNLLDVDKKTQQLVRIWRNLDDVRKYMINDHLISEDEHNRWLEKIRVGSKIKAWVIYYNKKPIGLMNLNNINWTDKITDWGIYIADNKIRGKGVGSAALIKLIDLVFTDLNFAVMKTLVLDNNNVAINLYEKMGFKKHKNIKHKIIRDGKKINVFLMSMTQQDYKEKK